MAASDPEITIADRGEFIVYRDDSRELVFECFLGESPLRLNASCYFDGRNRTVPMRLSTIEREVVVPALVAFLQAKGEAVEVVW